MEQQQTVVSEVIREQITKEDRCLLTTWFPTKSRATIRYEWTHGTQGHLKARAKSAEMGASSRSRFSPKKIIIRIISKKVYGEEVMSRQMVGHRCRMFGERRRTVENEGQSGHSSRTTDKNNIIPCDFHCINSYIESRILAT
ncbi:hypothetical protein TNCV_4117481 [Trichonephila clavipes]|nr:hypothetical protein TNCV_4117481 [Trichonephila clavipes]